MSEPSHCCRGIVSGRVQGVGFRYFVRSQAQRLSLSGWVVNRSDGTVEFHVEGPQSSIGDFLNRVRQGPSLSRVDRLSVRDAAPEGLRVFQIKVE